MSSDKSVKSASDPFEINKVSVLSEEDFTTDRKDLNIGLKSKKCTLILFYSDNIESQNLASIWKLVASQTVGPVFAACNLSRNKIIAEAFNTIKQSNVPFKWVGLRGLPFILVYRNGWPAAFYNGEREVQSIVDYSMTLACNAGYHEILNLPASIKVDKNYEMTGWKEYKSQRKSSVEYKSGSPVRVYDDKIPVEVGSAAAKKEAREVDKEESEEGINLSNLSGQEESFSDSGVGLSDDDITPVRKQ